METLIKNETASDMSFIPDATSGIWSVEAVVVKESLLFKIGFMKTGRGVPPGTYTRLVRGGTVVMSNTPDELRDFRQFVRVAQGDILINGLGLGCVVKALLEKESITSITVIEKSEDVIALVRPYFTDARLTVIHADAFEHKPPKTAYYNAVWHDIWDYICADNLPEMTRLHRKYAKKTSWQASWAKPECLRLR